jgi:transcriptional regulator with XRE-family HTH domain
VVATLAAPVVPDPPKPTYLALGEAILAIRNAWELTQDGFGSLGGWSGSTIRRWEKGGRPNVKNLVSLEQLTPLRGPYYQLPPRDELEALRPRGAEHDLELARKLRRLMRDEHVDSATLERLLGELRDERE